MNFLLITGIINFVATFAIGAFLLRNYKDKTIQLFSIYCFAVAAWSATYVLWSSATTEDAALFGIRVLFFPVAYIAITYYHFTLLYVGQAQKYKHILILGYIFFISTSLFVLSPWFIAGVEYYNDWGIFVPNPSVIFYPFLCIWLLLTVLSSIHLYAYGLKASKHKRWQTRVVLLGLVVAFIAGSTNYLMFFDVMVYPYANAAVPIFSVCTAYAISRYRMFNKRVVLRRNTIREATVVLLVIFTALLSIVVHEVTQSYILQSTVWIAAVYSIIWIRKNVNINILFQETYDLSIPTELQLTDMTTNGVEKVIGDVAQTLNQNLQLVQQDVYIYDWHDKLFQKRTVSKSGIEALRPDHPLLQTLTDSAYGFFVASAHSGQPVQRAAKQFTHSHSADVALALRGNGVICAIILFSTDGPESIEACLQEDNLIKIRQIGETYGYYIERLLTYQAIEEQLAEERVAERATARTSHADQEVVRKK